MLVGHVAAGLLARSRHSELSAGTYVFAAMAADLLAFAFVLAGIERIEFVDARGAGRYFHPLEIGFSHSLAQTSAGEPYSRSRSSPSDALVARQRPLASSW